ncbi:MAG: hypothetical protein K0S33_964 [Bacteroidetes bacterium]|jgi:hypothetical protein|nr:hypothetical protein [Bacteroidota bacterium]
MPKAYSVLATGLILLCSACNDTEPAATIITSIPVLTDTIYQPFPSGYGYLQDTAKLSMAVKESDIGYIREHAWRLWAGIMQPAQGMDWPVWYTWPNSTDAFSPDSSTAISTRAIEKIMTTSLIKQNAAHVIMDTLHLPVYPIPKQVISAYRKYGVFTHHDSDIASGKHFMSNGDILIPTESLSKEGFEWIRGNRLYKASVLDTLFAKKIPNLNAPAQHIVTKHMYWPVLDSQLCALPVWVNTYPPGYSSYAGYETWNNVVAVDASGLKAGKIEKVSYLYGVFQTDKKTPIGPFTKKALVYSINDFYHHKVTQADWDSFDPADKAIINASSYWAYNKPFEPGDYLITVAMHINTKEVPTWALQSVWWTDDPDAGGIYAQNKPELPDAKGPWKHYNMTDAYGTVDPLTGYLPIAMNPYIELVIHPIETNCNNCHMRAGWPTGSVAGKASYQNPDCPNLLQKLNAQSPCLQEYMRSDFQWIIPDHAISD